MQKRQLHTCRRQKESQQQNHLKLFLKKSASTFKISLTSLTQEENRSNSGDSRLNLYMYHVGIMPVDEILHANTTTYLKKKTRNYMQFLIFQDARIVLGQQFSTGDISDFGSWFIFTNS